MVGILRIKRILLTAGICIFTCGYHLVLLSVTSVIPATTYTRNTNYFGDGECKLLDVNGKEVDSFFAPADGAVIFSATIFGEKRVSNVIHMLKNLLPATGNDEGLANDDKTNLSPQHAAMIVVSGNETLVPLLKGFSESVSPLETRVFIANLTRDFGPISRVAAADLCFPPSKNYTIVVGDDDVIYNPQAVFHELPDYLRRVQQSLTNNSAAMVGYVGMHWIYYRIKWGPFVKGAAFRQHMNGDQWNLYRDTAPSKACTDLNGAELNVTADASSLCENVIPTGLLECYGLVAFQRSALNPLLYERHHHPKFLPTCFWGDDFWLSYFAFRMNIPRFVVRGGYVLIGKLPQPDGSVGSKTGMTNMMNYRNCEKNIFNKLDNCSWCIPENITNVTMEDPAFASQ